MEPTDEDIQALLDRAAALSGETPQDNGDESEIPDGWNDLWQRYDQFVIDHPYLSE